MLRTLTLTFLLLVSMATAQAQAAYLGQSDGSVLDTTTGLLWQHSTSSQTYTWGEALAYCEALTAGGHTDWRLPNIRELASLLHFAYTQPVIHPTFSVASPDSRYWSSTSSSGTLALGVVFHTAFITGVAKTPANPEDPYGRINVRCVRGGGNPPVLAKLLLLLL